MKTYGFDFISADGSVRSVDVGVFGSHGDALYQARRELAASLTSVAVEIWCEGVQVARLDRGVPLDLSAALTGDGP